MNNLTRNQFLKTFDGKEVVFITEVLIPVFRGMGFEVNFNHGAYEFGKDLILRKIDDFSQAKYIAVVAKVGDIVNTSSKAKTVLQEVERQVGQAWNTTFSSAIWNEKNKQVAEVIVVTNGNISNTAQEQIMNSINVPNRAATSYLDQEKLIPLITKYYPELWTSELPILSKYLNAFKRYIEQITETDNVDPMVHDLISTYCERKTSFSEPDSKLAKGTVPAIEIIQSGKRLWIQGGTGSGKTFVAHNYVRAVANSIKKNQKAKGSALPIPVYLKAAWFRGLKEISLSDILSKSLVQLKIEVADSDLASWKKSHGFCIFIDEFEINMDSSILNQIDERLKAETKGSVIVVLSRFLDESSVRLSYIPEVWLVKEINLSKASKALSTSMPISNPKAKSLYKEVIQGGMLERLPRTPLAINILRKVFVDLQLGKLPNNAFEFFEMFFDITLGKWEQQRDPSQPMDFKQVKALLQSIAYRMVSTARVSIPLEEIEDLATDLLATTGQKNVSPKDYLHRVASFGEVCRIVEGNFEFVQRTYLEFLAGCEIKDHHWNIPQLVENYIKVNWEDSIIFAAGGKQKDDQLLRALIERKTEDFNERFAKLKNIGLISQALYHSTVAAKAQAVQSGADETIRFRDENLPQFMDAAKIAKYGDITYTITALHMFSIFYGKRSLLSALEELLKNGEPNRRTFYYASAYAVIGEEEVDTQIFKEAISKLGSISSPENSAFGGYLTSRERISDGLIKKIVSGKKAKQFAEKTKKVFRELKRSVIPESRRK